MSKIALPKKSLGQHWLNDQSALEAMAEAAKLKNADVVLEIGPGLGALTKLLIEQVKQVIAVELDEALAERLPQEIPATNLTVVQEDILQFDLTSLPPDYKVVANIPYYLTSNLIRVLSESSNPPSTAALLVQKEVAERVVAEPGAASILSITAQFYWLVASGQVVSAELFTPPPKVDSQILILSRRAKPLFPDVDSKQFFRLVKAGFSQRRKTLLNSLSAGLNMSRPETLEVLKKAGVNPVDRAQSLSLENWHELYRHIK